MQGVGIIETIEEKEVLGQKQLYYTLNLPQNNMQIMIPIEKAAALGIRQIVEPDILENVLTDFHVGNTLCSSPFPLNPFDTYFLFLISSSIRCFASGDNASIR